MLQVSELPPGEFCDHWPETNGKTNVLLLDVREAEELDIASVTRAIHIPMRDVPGRLSELDPLKPLVVMCHSGARSRRVAEFLLANGFQQVFNLAGGIDAWSQEIDTDIPRY